jgi:hypothetical protein
MVDRIAMVILGVALAGLLFSLFGLLVTLSMGGHG